MAKVNCRRCLGTGRLDGYKHIQMGMCLGCDGAGMVDDKATREAKAEEYKAQCIADANAHYERMVAEAMKTPHAGMRERQLTRAAIWLERNTPA